MHSLALTEAVTAIANVMARHLTLDELALLAGIFVQLGDTIATIAALENLHANKAQANEQV